MKYLNLFSKILNIKTNLESSYHNKWKEYFSIFYHEKIELPFYTFLDYLKDLTKSKEDIRKFNNSVANVLERENKKYKKYKRIMNKIKKISEKQKDIQYYLKTPQNGVLDGHYRNSLIEEYNELNEKRIKLFKKILKLGFDPVLKINSKEGLKIGPLSEMISYLEKTEDKKETKNKPKLTVIKGGKD